MLRGGRANHVVPTTASELGLAWSYVLEAEALIVCYQVLQRHISYCPP